MRKRSIAGVILADAPLPGKAGEPMSGEAEHDACHGLAKRRVRIAFPAGPEIEDVYAPHRPGPVRRLATGLPRAQLDDARNPGEVGPAAGERPAGRCGQVRQPSELAGSDLEEDRGAWPEGTE